MTDLLVERSAEITTLTLNRPDRANALSPDLVESLIAAMSDLGSTRLVVIRGEGKLFCAGFDLSDIDSLSDGDLLWRFLRIEHLLQLVHHAPCSVLALAHKHAIGAGADLLLAASNRVIAPGTGIRMPGLNFELTLGTRRLHRMVGSTLARDILVDTRRVDADEALRVGLVEQVVAMADWSEVIDAQLKRSTSLSPMALAAMLDATRTDTRHLDIASIVTSGGRPGLRDRVKQYMAEVERPVDRTS